jgi:hypothetical protein
MRSIKVEWVFVMQERDAKRFPTRAQRHGQSLLCGRIFPLPEDLRAQLTVSGVSRADKVNGIEKGVSCWRGR